jgi:hypothetical protein
MTEPVRTFRTLSARPAGGGRVWRAIEARMGTFLAPALGVVDEVFARYPEIPFGRAAVPDTDR